ncbi:Chalcone isomerase-like [Marinobacter daqiaonensis]|uniref:Chalcone isomerase-like n=1 Tax=Marinobacter daqiaonensis TaxID=650891 RepID=A0A1I6GFU3_9GAMM|nr:chalcone isomerase family protein [Marinobacter daqiaonensis]SFR41000.1 Chalcone isomerase-like [Marinobacter daqiaonensis]
MVFRALAGVSGMMLALLLAGGASAATVDGTKVRDTLTAGDTELFLNGAGTRSKFFIKLYVAALYLPEKSTDASAILAAEEPQAIALHVTSGRINSDNMTEATLEGLDKSTDGNMAPIQDEVDALLAVFADEISEGDVFDLVYVPDEGVQVIKNGELGRTIGDRQFKEALFGIWLSDDPVQGSLKADMLGK